MFCDVCAEVTVGTCLSVRGQASGITEPICSRGDADTTPPGGVTSPPTPTVPAASASEFPPGSHRRQRALVRVRSLCQKPDRGRQIKSESSHVPSPAPGRRSDSLQHVPRSVDAHSQGRVFSILN
ncbi:hypothetical protein AAFF_G00136850 [Aldrovandia affinis]|uniref:Uncharacterized protein n=1 Tax=Aldrovandia affinis TaxID=143900 RepID=A0AAD7TBM4_9TELE|nr:hypothetical protein AAFF_G00136850 [Aldrovandia affinis]